MPTWMPRARSGRGEVERARELVRLHADQHHHAGAGRLDHASRCASGRMRVLVSSKAWMSMSTSSPSTLPLGAVLGEAVERGERVRRDGRAEPLDDVAVVVVMRRLDHQDGELRARATPCRTSRNHPHHPAALSCQRNSVFTSDGRAS